MRTQGGDRGAAGDIDNWKQVAGGDEVGEFDLLLRKSNLNSLCENGN